jgi:stress-induced morphogen
MTSSQNGQESLFSAMQKKLQDAFEPKYFVLENESHQHSGPGSETHFKLIMVSDEFEGQSRINRHRQVTDLLAAERNRGLHALTLRLFTQDEWEIARDGFIMESPACHGGSRRTV